MCQISKKEIQNAIDKYDEIKYCLTDEKLLILYKNFIYGDTPFKLDGDIRILTPE